MAPAPVPAAQLGLKRCTAMPIERHMHGAAVVGPRIYVLGGNREVNGKEEWLDSVISAEILPSGDLGPWRDELPMPERRHYIGSSVEVVNNRIYVVAGNVAPAVDTPENNVDRARDVLWTAVKSDGTLEGWKKSTPFPGDPRACLATCSNDRYLYVLGGSIGAGITNSVLRGTFGPDNAPGDWKEIVPLATPLWFHGAAIMDDTMYVWGGLTQRSHMAANPNVYAAKVNSDGSLQPWRTVGTMPHPIFSAAFCGFNDHLVCVAGRYAGGAESRGIWYTRLQNGLPTNWVLVDTDLAARVYLTLGLDKTRGWIFIPGGRYRDALNPNGAIQRVVQAFYVPQPAGTAFKESASAPVQPTAGGVTPLALVEAIARAAQEKKPILVFFHSPAVPAARRVWETVSGTPQFQQASQTHIWAEVDISRESSGMVYEYGVFKVPALVKLAPTGQRLGPAIPFAGPEDLARLAAP
jgi:hypothetical protein